MWYSQIFKKLQQVNQFRFNQQKIPTSTLFNLFLNHQEMSPSTQYGLMNQILK